MSNQQKEHFRQWYKKRNHKEILNDYANNFLTVEGMADHYGIDVEDMKYAIETARHVIRRQYEWKKKAQKFNETGSYY